MPPYHENIRSDVVMHSCIGISFGIDPPTTTLKINQKKKDQRKKNFGLYTGFYLKTVSINNVLKFNVYPHKQSGGINQLFL